MTDPEILADIVNFSQNLNVKVSVSKECDGNEGLEPPLEALQFSLKQIKVALMKHKKEV